MTTRIGFETYLDRCIETVSTAQASCIYNLKKRYCNKRDCSLCEKGQRISRIYQSLSEVDQLQADNQTSIKAGLLLYAHKGGKNPETPKEKFGFALRWILGGIGIGALILCILGCFVDSMEFSIIAGIFGTFALVYIILIAVVAAF